MIPNPNTAGVHACGALIHLSGSALNDITHASFQAKGKSKYGVPIFLPNGNVNPAYLAAERAVRGCATIEVPLGLMTGPWVLLRVICWVWRRSLLDALCVPRSQDLREQSKRNTKSAEAKRKALIGKKSFELADYVRKKIGAVGSGKDYYQSGR